MKRLGLLLVLSSVAGVIAARGLPAPEGTAVAAPRPSGTVVFLSSANRLTSVDVATGRRTARRIRSVPACGPELHVTGGHVIFAGLRRQRTVVFSVPIALDRPPVRLGAAHAFVPSATEGRVWLAGVECTRRRMVGVQEVAVDGRVTFGTRRRVPGMWVAGAIDAGLLIQGSGGLFAWDPRTGRSGRRLGLRTVADVQGSLMAGCAPGSRCRRLTLVDADDGSVLGAQMANRHRLDSGAELSPDGSLLAAPALAGRQWRVAVIDTDDGSTTIIPGSLTGGMYPELGWASTGWLFFRAGERRLMAYRPGENRAVVLPFRLPKRTVSFVAG